MKILILGGYGVFGGRLAELISDLPDVTLLIAGRSATKAKAFCERYNGVAEVIPLEMDRCEIMGQLQEQCPDLVVDASGPFQDYGDNRYQVVEACISAQTPYLDFADAADFVFGISKFDHAAKQAGVFILSGVSSFPVLTAAVLREMAKDMDIECVEGGIAPSPYAGIGLNVMRAVVGYAGGPVKLMREGKPAIAKGLTESRRFTIAPPGELPLNNIHFSLVDVPDLQVIPTEHETLTDIWMGAGPTPESLHKILNLLAKLRAIFRFPALTLFSPFFYSILNLMKFGEHRGGMYVRACGSKDGHRVAKSWHLLAEGDDGPYIPSMAIEAIIRKYLKGIVPEHGARAATHALSLEDYQDLFSQRSIHFGFRDDHNQKDRIYEQLLGDLFKDLPTQVAKLHTSSNHQVWKGEAEVKRGQSLLSKCIAWCLNFPAAGIAVPVEVTISRKSDLETWTRTFGGKVFKSTQKLGIGRQQHLMIETFGAISVALAVVLRSDRLYMEPRQWKLWGLPLPKFLLPTGGTFETEESGFFRFDVTIKAPLVGLIISYRGLLKQSCLATGRAHQDG